MNMMNKSVPSLLPITRLDVVAQDRLGDSERQLLGKAEIDSLGQMEAWTAIGTNKELGYATHGAMRFFGKFPPPIAAHLIERYAPGKSVVIDPMAGSGTTAVECVLRGKACYSFDVNPLMLLLARVKTTRLMRDEVGKVIASIVDSYEPSSFERNRKKFVGLKKPEHWFLDATLDSLLGIKQRVDEVESVEVRELLTVALLAVVRRVSKATTQQGRLFLDVETAQEDALPFFYKKAVGLSEMVSALPVRAAPISIQQHSILEDPREKAKELADLVILHPPYFNSYKYSGVTSLETFWMNIDHAEVRKSEVREFFKVGKVENHQKYVDDMATALTNSISLLKPGARLALMMGDTVIKGEYVPVVKRTLQRAGIRKKNIETVAVRVPKYTEASWAASQRRSGKNVGITLSDFVVVIRK